MRKSIRYVVNILIKSSSADQTIQIITGSADGSIHVLYSPLTSLKGATLAVTRTPRVRAPDAFSTASDIDRPIIAPHSLPMFKDDHGEGSGRIGKRRRERERHDPQKTMKPSEYHVSHALSNTMLMYRHQCRLLSVLVAVAVSVLLPLNMLYKAWLGTTCVIKM